MATDLRISYMHTTTHGWIVVYGQALQWRCNTRKFALGMDEAIAIAQVLTLMGSTYESIPEDFRKVKATVQRGYDLLRVKRRMQRWLPAWTQAQFDNDIHFAACDSFEGKRANFSFA